MTAPATHYDRMLAAMRAGDRESSTDPSTATQLTKGTAMADRRYINPKTGEVVDDPDIRSFDQVLRELGEGATISELSESFWDLVQRVQDTGKAGSLTLTVAVGFDGHGRIQIKDEVKVKLPEHNRPTTAFFLDRQGNASRRDPNQPMIPTLEDRRNKEAN